LPLIAIDLDRRNSDEWCLLERMAAEDFAGDCQHHDSEVKPDRPILNVRQVASDPVLYLFDGFGFTTPAVYLSPSSDAGFDAVTERILGDNIAKQLVRRFGVGRMRAWSDDGHVAPQHIE
jgi:hypothetical protein